LTGYLLESLHESPKDESRREFGCALLVLPFDRATNRRILVSWRIANISIFADEGIERLDRAQVLEVLFIRSPRPESPFEDCWIFSMSNGQ
jgi:hypothetical protein